MNHQPHHDEQAQPEYTHIGAYFRDMREHYRLTVQQVSDRLHIRAKYIEAIEQGDLSAMPGKVYTQGYIHSYAEFLGLDAEKVIAQYEGLDQADQRPRFMVTAPTEQRGTPSWPWIMAALIVLVAGYALWQQLSKPAAPPVRTIDEVPERIQEKARNALLLTPENRECLALQANSQPLPCYYPERDVIAGPFILSPVRSVMELH